VGTPVPIDLDPENQLFDPEFADPTQWIFSTYWNIVGGDAIFQEFGPTKSFAMQNKKVLLPETQYRIEFGISNLNLLPADSLKLNLGGKFFAVTKANGDHVRIITSPVFAFPKLYFAPVIPVSAGQSLMLEYFYAYDIISEDLTINALNSQEKGYYDAFDLGGSESMSFYASKTDRTRVWVKHG